jgi:uncharacterized protein YndB with AHSA1/START domain
MTSMTAINVTTQVFQVFIKASQEAIWDAITKPEWNERYGYPGKSEYDLRPGGAFRAISSNEMIASGAPEVGVDGEVEEADPPHKLVQTWRFHFTPETEAEGFTRVIWETHEEGEGLTRLTVTHEVDGAPHTAEMVTGLRPLHEGGGGWPFVLSDLKTLLETGKSFHV